MEEATPTQRLHLVMGGRVKDPRGHEFVDPEGIHTVGVYSSYDAAVDAWRAQAQRTVDDAEMKYVVVHIHKLLTPEEWRSATITGSGSIILAMKPGSAR